MFSHTEGKVCPLVEKHQHCSPQFTRQFLDQFPSSLTTGKTYQEVTNKWAVYSFSLFVGGNN